MISNYNEQVQQYFQRGRDQKFRYMIVMEDTFDYEDYPVYLNTIEECDKYIWDHNGKNMARFLSLFDLASGKKLRGL